MSGIERVQDVIGWKKKQNPQFDYMWRVSLPDLSTFVDKSGGQELSRYVRQYVDKSKAQTETFANIPSRSNMQTPIITSTVMTSERTLEVSSRVYEFTAPLPSFDTRKSTHGTRFRYAVDHDDIGTLSMVIDEMEDGMSLQYINEWMGLIKNSDGTTNPPGVYKKDIKFIKLSASQTDIHVSQYIGFFPTEVSPVQYSYDGTSVSQYSVTFTGDSVEHTFVPIEDVKAAIEREEQSILGQPDNLELREDTPGIYRRGSRNVDIPETLGVVDLDKPPEKDERSLIGKVLDFFW